MSHAHNVDPAEISKFEELAARWWDPESEFKPLHQINPLRLDYIDQRSNGLAGRTVLDVGCGGGILAESMAVRGGKVTGIDMGEANLQVARLHLLETGQQVNYERIPVEELAREMPGHFDVVTCMEMLEHVPDPSSIVRACAALVKPGGTVFFSTINRNPKAYLMAVVGAEYLLRLLPKGTHDYSKFIKPSEMAAWIREAELELDHQCGLLYNPLSGRFRLDERDVDVNYMLATHKPA